MNLGKRLARQQGYERPKLQIYFPPKLFVPFFITLLIFSLITFSGARIKSTAASDYSGFVSYAAQTDTSAIAVALQQLKSAPDADFDGDGLSNRDELDMGTDPYNQDTDFDGMTDGAEVYDTITDPTAPDRFTYIPERDAATGEKVNMPFEINKVVLWADDMESKVNASVVKTPEGYKITGFKGWVQFRDPGFPYAKSGGVRREMRTNTLPNGIKVYHIDGDCFVTLEEEKLHPIGLLNVFGKSEYISNDPFSEVVLPIFLPEQSGLISYRKLMNEDTQPDTRDDIVTKAKTPEYTLTPDRFHRNDNDGATIKSIRKSIANDTPVIISLFSQTRGEAVLMVYGVTPQGHLLVADPETRELMGTIIISETGKRTLAINNVLGFREWFEFFGCGFSSGAGDRIAVIPSTPAQEIIQIN